MSAPILPYNPTRVFPSPNDPGIIYILSSSNSNSSQSQLLYLNVSSTVQASDLSLQTITPLPFVNGSDNGENISAYVPAISKSGTIGVYAGSCSSTSSLWLFQSQNTSSSSSHTSLNGTWTQMSTSASSSSSSNVVGTHFLSSAFYFSSLVNTDDTQRTIYSFGGMCPTSTSSTNISTWQNLATYSNSILKLNPSSSSTSSYQISLSAATGNGPIPEAGFTITGVLPTISNSSSGIVTQAQNYVLIGGHTKTAFINMSQVAIFSLPQESWSFQTIDPGASTGNTVLTTTSTSSTSSTPSTTSQTPDSRSGHSSILSADGSAIIVFGGWVGDINTPADPQLAILQLGSGFGGSGDWAWNIPTTTGAGLQSGAGIYGHDAVMLPGDVMMVVGGFTITSSNTKSKRDTSSQQVYFLNTSSMTWQTTYANPSYIAASGSSSSSSSTTTASNKSKQVGLGAGLGLGFAAIIGAIAFYFWYTRKVKRRKEEAREKDLQRLSRTASNGIDPWWNSARNSEMVQRQGLMSSPYSNSNYSGYGDDPNTYSPGNGDNSYNNVPRKPLNLRTAGNHASPIIPGSNQPYSNYNYDSSIRRANSLGTAGIIHPIYEADEDNDIADTQLHPQDTQNQDPNDPFRDPPLNDKYNPLRSHPLSRNPTSDRNTPSPESPHQEQDHSIKEWASDWAAADAQINPNSASHSRNHSYNGRSSPSKESVSGRTASNLSERSAASANALALSRNSSTNTRANSLTAFLAASGASGWNPFNNNNNHGLGAIDERYNSGGNISPESRPPHSSGSGSGTSGSYTTAHTSSSNHKYHPTAPGASFNVIRSDGDTLLGGRNNNNLQGSPSKHKPRGGWLGSLKRVFVGEEWVSSDGSGSPSPTKQYADYHNSPLTISTHGSPAHPSYNTPDMSLPAEPRRTVSASATLWRRKQGRGDWEDSAEPNDRKRSSTMTLDAERLRDDLQMDQGQGSGGGGADAASINDDEDWDIERAIERRMVQIMFTVPRNKLRVVNQDIEVEPEDEDITEAALASSSALNTKKSTTFKEPLVERTLSASSSMTTKSSHSKRQQQQQGKNPFLSEEETGTITPPTSLPTSSDVATTTESATKVFEERYKSCASSLAAAERPRQHPTSGRALSELSRGDPNSPTEPTPLPEKYKSSTASPPVAGFRERLRQHPTSGRAFSASPLVVPMGVGSNSAHTHTQQIADEQDQHTEEWKCSVEDGWVSPPSRPVMHHELTTSGRALLDPGSAYSLVSSSRERLQAHYQQQQQQQQHELLQHAHQQQQVGLSGSRSSTPLSVSRETSKGKGRVQELVERIESPSSSPASSPRFS